MLDGNSAAELDNDCSYSIHNRISRSSVFELESMRWLMIRDALLRGESLKNVFHQEFSLNVRLGEEYQEFADLIDQNFDIMAAYNRGELHPAVRELIFNEANTLASVICG